MIPRAVIAVGVPASLVTAFLLGRGTTAVPPVSAMPLPTRSADEQPIQSPTLIQRTTDKTNRGRKLAAYFADKLTTDPLAALAEVRRVESLRHDSARVATAFADWAYANPTAAAHLITTTLDGRQIDAAQMPPFIDGIDPPDFLLSVVHGLGLAAPSLAAQTLSATADSPVRTDAIEVLLQDWHSNDPAAAQSWAASLTEPYLRATALTTVAQKSGQTAPDAGIAWIETLPATDRPATYHALLSQWSQRHARDAFAWAAALPDGDLKFALMPTVIRPLTAVDPGTAADWLNRYEASPAMDDSIAAYARAIAHVNPTAARGSIAAITDPKKRARLLKKLDLQAP